MDSDIFPHPTVTVGTVPGAHSGGPPVLVTFALIGCLAGLVGLAVAVSCLGVVGCLWRDHDALRDRVAELESAAVARAFRLRAEREATCPQ
jgi:hypothetical protein